MRDGGEGDRVAAVVTMDTGPGIQRIEEQLNDLLSMVSTIICYYPQTVWPS